MTKIDVLLFSVEQGRFGPPRLPQILTDAGLRVAALCPAQNLLGLSRHLVHHAILPDARTLGALGGALCAAIATARPALVVPGDEQAVMILHALTRGRGRRLAARSGNAVPDTIAASLGDPAHYDASLLKSATLAAARAIGVPVPRSETVLTADAAVAAAEAMGYPVYLKESFSWAGRGVAQCGDAAAVRAGFAATRLKLAPVRRLARRLADRDWYPVETATDIQSGVAGAAAMVAALAWQGRLVGAVCAEKLALTNTSGPSIAVRLQHDAAMVDHSAALVSALGLHGLVSFDFMVPDDGGPALLLECNPRPVAIHHIGRVVGVDFAELLASLLHGSDAPAQPMIGRGIGNVLLFPNSLDPAWVREAKARDWLLDLPSAEPALVDAAEARPAAERRLPLPSARNIAA